MVNMKFNKKTRVILVVLTLLILLGTISGMLVAKYITSRRQYEEMLSENFHVSSDYLESEGEVLHTVTDWVTNGITFKIYNYEKENTALVSASEIKYKITAPSGWDVSVTDSNGNFISVQEGVYAIPSDGNTKTYQLVKLTPSDNADINYEYEVRVDFVSPYTKTLSAKFKLDGDKLPDYKIKDMGNYVLITLHSNEYNDKVTFTWTEKVSPDNTNPYMKDWFDGTVGKFLYVEPMHTYELIFYKNTDENYSEISGTHITAVEIGG